jgi:hypothetical protein
VSGITELAGVAVLGFDTESKPTFSPASDSSDLAASCSLATRARRLDFNCIDLLVCRAALAGLLCAQRKVGF